MKHQQIFAGPLRVRHVMVAVSRFPRARRIRTLHLPCFDRGLQVGFQNRHLGVERSLDFRKFDLALRLDLQMDRVVLCV